MKLVFFALVSLCTFLIPAIGSAACSKKVDPNKVILFLNVNGSYSELDGAIEAACERGETLVVIPDSPSSQVRQQLAAADGHARDVEDIELHCDGRIPTDPKHPMSPEVCNTARENSSRATATYTALVEKNHVQSISESLVTAKINELAAKNIGISSLVISGHDGGGEFSSDSNVFIHSHDIFDSLNSAYAKKPELLSKLQTMLLWGCYTATPEQITYWKQNVPSLRLIAGFSSIAPASVRPASKFVMKDTLIKQDLAIKAKNSQSLKAIMEGIKFMNYTSFGMFVEPCVGDGLFMANEMRDPKDVTKGFEHKFQSMDQLKSCDGMEPSELKIYQNGVNRYYEGEIPIPADTSKGDLREIYTFSRQHEGCIPDYANMNGDHVGLLLFFNSVKLNFAAADKKLVSKVDELLNNPSDLIAKLQKLATASYENEKSRYKTELEEQQKQCDNTNLEKNVRFDWCSKITFSKDVISEIQADIEKINSPERTAHYYKTITDFKNAYWAPTLDNIQNKSRVEILRETNILTGIANELGTPELAKLSNDMQRYLVDLSTDCMDFLEWHEYRPNQAAPKMRCTQAGL